MSGCTHCPPPAEPLVIHEVGPTVEVPVVVRCEPPAWLLAQTKMPAQLRFLTPTPSGNNLSCLASEGETALQKFVGGLDQQNRALRAFVRECGEK